ncbi:hypothetical protein Droror1_Dr00011843 [Drosera rotundifolia]
MDSVCLRPWTTATQEQLKIKEHQLITILEIAWPCCTSSILSMQGFPLAWPDQVHKQSGEMQDKPLSHILKDHEDTFPKVGGPIKVHRGGEASKTNQEMG